MIQGWRDRVGGLAQAGSYFLSKCRLTGDVIAVLERTCAQNRKDSCSENSVVESIEKNAECWQRWVFQDTFPQGKEHSGGLFASRCQNIQTVRNSYRDGSKKMPLIHRDSCDKNCRQALAKRRKQRALLKLVRRSFKEGNHPLKDIMSCLTHCVTHTSCITILPHSV